MKSLKANMLERLSPVHTRHMDPKPGFPQQRRPRGFAAAAAPSATDAKAAGNTSVTGKRGREKEKERTKLRERHRRAITSRMLAGLRQYGNLPLPARADMNDVIAAFARDAGWTVEADGTTYKQSLPQPQPQHQGTYSGSLTEGLSASKSSYGVKTVLENQTLVAMAVRSNESMSPVSLDSIIVPERDSKNEKYSGCSGISSAAMCLDTDQLIQDVNSEDGEHISRNEGVVPVYVKLSNGFIDNYCQLINQEDVRRELTYINSLHADGVAVNCWWGIVEGWSPQKYMWSGYRNLFNIVREFKLKMQVVLAFHESGGHGTGDVFVTLPQWVLEIGKENLDIFFTDHVGRRCTECLSWGVDKERVLEGRTGVEVYFDFMRSFRTEFDDLFAEGLITAVEIGLGPSGELKYPSFHEISGWRFPGIGEFQCYGKYFQVSLEKAAELRGHSFWARAPDNAGDYNSRPHETGFFCERGDYDGYYGRFFLNWYAQYLMEHADCILSLANLTFVDINIVVKIPAIYWWYKTSSHAPELTAGYYNSANRDGYSQVFKILKKHNVTVKFTCSGLQTPNPGINEALSDPEGMIWQVVNCAWDEGLEVAGENDLSRYNRDALVRIVNIAKPKNDPDRHRFSFFVYRLASPFSETSIGFSELDFVIKSMHGILLNFNY